MKNFKAALLQILPEKTMRENLEKGIKACRDAARAGADIAIFPEMWSTGYAYINDINELKRKAVSVSSSFVQSFAELARELNMAIAITFLEEYSPTPRNTVCVFDRFGKLALTYAKVHTCDFDAEGLLTAGNDFPVAELNTKYGSMKIGAMICFDREFPESARILMLNGAEIIIVPNACPMEINRISQLRARAYENMVGIATVNYPSGKTGCNGHSTAFDPIAYRPNASDSRDTLILEAGEREGIYIADFPMDEIREYRKSEVHGNAYRHPKKYLKMISEEICEPFNRPDYRK